MFRTLAALTALGVVPAACASTKQPPDNARVCQVYGSQESGAEVVASGSVIEVLSAQGGPSSNHEGFLMRLNGSCDLLVRVETDTALTGRVPLQSGEKVEVKGEYEYDLTGGVIHWTHHDPDGRHDNGYVVAGNRTYQ